MKKIIMTVVVGCFSAFSYAATYNWNAKADWVSADGDNALEVMAYVFDASAYSSTTVSTSLTAGNTAILSSAIGSALISDEGWFELSGSGLTDDGETTPYAHAYVVLLDTSSASTAQHFYVSSIADAEITDAVSAGGAYFAWDEIVTGAPGGAGWTAVPEPTSGLLLLLGMAGLALKRKRA